MCSKLPTVLGVWWETLYGRKTWRDFSLCALLNFLLFVLSECITDSKNMQNSKIQKSLKPQEGNPLKTKPCWWKGAEFRLGWWLVPRWTVVTVVQQCECTWGHSTVHLEMVKMVDFMFCVFYCNRNSLKTKQAHKTQSWGHIQVPSFGRLPKLRGLDHLNALWIVLLEYVIFFF